jgi:hypothetical protein
MTIDPSKNIDIDAILEDIYGSEINASISWASPGRGFHATLGSATLVGRIPGQSIAPFTVYRTGRSGRSRQPNAYAR